MHRQTEKFDHLVALIAQLVEHFIRNEGVAGSSPAQGSKKKDRPERSGLFLSLEPLELRSVGAPAKAEGHKGHKGYKGRWSVIANLKVGKTIRALANLTTPQTPQAPFAPWGVPRRRNACSLTTKN